MAKKTVRAEPEMTPERLEIPLPLAGIGSLDYWQDEIEQATRRRKKEIPNWKRNLDRAYRQGKDKFFGLSANETIVVPTDFYNTEQKKAQLFFQTPYVQATPEQPMPDGVSPLYQHVLNYLLGNKEANAKATVNEVLTDVLCAAGIGPVLIGYEAVRVPVAIPTNRQEPDVDELGQTRLDAFGQPVTRAVVDPETGQPETMTIQRTIWDRYYMDRFSPAKLLIPIGMTTTQFDKGPWIGRDFDMDPSQISAGYGVKGADAMGEFSDENTLAPTADKDFQRSTARGIEVWYRANIYDPKAPPEEIRRLVLVAGKRKNNVAVIHERSKYQQFDEHGKLMKGMRGFPIHPLTIRVVSDSSYPPSDCQVARPLADEISIGRSQMLKQRSRNIPMRGFDALRVNSEIVGKIERGEWQGMIPFQGPISEDMFRELMAANFPNENFAFNGIIQQDLEKVWGFGANQVGGNSDRSVTATETTVIEQAKDVRMAADRTSVLDWFIAGVEKFASLPPIFADEAKFAEIEGPDGGMQLAQWTKADISARYAFSLRPDSAVRVNAAEQREMQLRFNNLTANNPYFNQIENAKALARAFNQDPSKLVKQPPPPPEPTPEKPKVSISIKGDDLDPSAPQYPNVLAVLGATGMPGLSQPVQQQPGPTPGGPIAAPAGVPPVDQHDAAMTGKMSGPPSQPRTIQ